MPKSLGSMPSPWSQHRQRQDPFNGPDTEEPKAAYPDSLGREALSFHLDSLESGVASPNHSDIEAVSCLVDAESKAVSPVTLAKYSEISLGVDTCKESKGLWVSVQAIQKQQEGLARTLDAVILQVQEQMRVMKSEIIRTQLELAADRKQRGEAKSSQPWPTAVPKHDIIDIANKVCDSFAGPLSDVIVSVRRAESDMEKLRSALLDVQENQERHSHGANEMQMAMGKLDKMVCQVLDVMNIEQSRSKWPAAAGTARTAPTIEKDQLLGFFGGSPVSRRSHPIKLNVQEVSPTLFLDRRQTCSLTAVGSFGEEGRSKTGTCVGTKEIPELWQRIYARSKAATQVGAK